MTLPVIDALGAALAAATLPGTVELCVLSVAGMLPARRISAAPGRTVRIAAVLPAHNEELNIARAVQSLLSADASSIDLTVVVVADNCEDRTADAAAAAGARVLVRRNAVERGKGYALDFAFRTLLPEGYDAFLVVDADSEASRNILTETAAHLRGGAPAVQVRYEVRNPGDTLRTRLMKIALCGFNVLRPRGRDKLGFSCGIYGNGFTLAASTLRSVPYTATSVVEDLEYHLALVRAGLRVRFADGATVWGDMPVAGAGVKTQRARWEGGRFRMLASHAPRLAVEAVRGRWRMLEPCLDLLLLPLAFHVVLLLMALAVPSAISRTAGIAGLAVLVVHLTGAVRLAGGDYAALAAAPFYVAWKILMLPRVLRSARSGAAWVRTERARE
jgi:cellulose synthase/poly-beta-1,6-N-acetylglucosamine synthase-like glycosyltransferase